MERVARLGMALTFALGVHFAPIALPARAAEVGGESAPEPAPGSVPSRTSPHAFSGIAGLHVFFAAALDAREQSVLVETLRKALESEGIRVMTIAEEKEVLGESELPDYCPESPPCLRELAARLRVDRLALLLLTAGPATVLVEMIIADGASGYVLYRLRRGIDRSRLSDAGALRDFVRAVTAPPTSKLSVVSNVPGARVFVAGTYVGRAPLRAPVVVRPGTLEIVVRKGDLEFSRRIWLAGGSEEEVLVGGDVRSTAGRLARSPWLWVGIGAGLVVGAAVSFAVTFAILR